MIPGLLVGLSLLLQLLLLLLAAAAAAAATTAAASTVAVVGAAAAATAAATGTGTGTGTVIGTATAAPTESTFTSPISQREFSTTSKQLMLLAARDESREERASQERKDKGVSLASEKQQAGLVYTNQFVIQVKGGEHEARKLAEKHGFVYLNHILGDYYHLEHKRLSKRSTSPNDDDDEEALSIQDEPQVLKVERQLLKRRVKRDFLELPATQTTVATAHNSASPQSHLQQLHPAHSQTHKPNQLPRLPTSRLGGAPRPLPNTGHQYTRPANQPARGRPRPLPSLEGVDTIEAAAGQQARPTLAQAQAQAQARPSSVTQIANLRDSTTIVSTNSSSLNHNRPFNDPSWPLMWYLDGGAKNGFDLNVMAAWKMGYTGKGIVITILDDGLERNHPDLQANYDPLASFDINGDDADPMPRYDELETNRHGTRCAGEVAAVPDNNICSIGIAYNSKVGGVRMLDGDVTDAVEARSLGLNNQHIHIYSASWGPDDNGRTVDGPGELATRAFIEGVTNGRQGLGSIFVFASGNGGREHDNCNCDGYTNSIWTLSISSATENGYVPWYIEACSSTLATTYSSGSYDERQISTTDIRGTCTSGHTGTSASAPLAAGICALVLESNPRLTWRDMQHIVVRTAKPANLVAKDWRQNALGRNVSHAFGYGLMDAAGMISMAKRWTSVPVQYTCEVRSPQMEKFIPAKGYIELKLRAECANVKFLEHVQSKVTLSSNRRGDLHIYLISPHGTRSTLLAQRPNDQAEQGFRNWPFMTVHSWGESPNGVWTLEVHNDGKPQNRAYLKEWTLILYGTSDDPNKHLDSTQTSQSSHNQQHTRPPINRVPAPESQNEHKRPQVSPHWPAFPYGTRPPVTPPLNQGNPGAGSGSPPHRQQQQQFLSGTGSVPSQLPAGKPDFEIVTPPTTTSSSTPASVDVVSSPIYPTTTPSSHEPPSSVSTTTSSAPATNELPPKPPVTLMEHNKIDATPITTNTNPPSGSSKNSPADLLMMQSGSQTTTPANSNNQSTVIQTTTTPEPANELQLLAGNNQIDLKLLTKDYRSSGDQSTNIRPETPSSSAHSNTLNYSNNDSNNHHQRPNHPSSSASIPNFMLHKLALDWPLNSALQLLLTLLVANLILQN